ncbi:MAG: acetyl-CoA carboxylase biotin carboxyl carrier protein subunit [Prevotella sp.]|nr:acetyl-CoA carboxylase biotin carboxyl carrier protein subunit [Prevotella sp.]
MAKYIINGKEYEVEITDVQGNLAKIKVNGTAYEVETEEKLHAMPTKAATVARPKVTQVAAPVQAAPVVAVAPVVEAASAAATPSAGEAGGTKVTAPLPGTITDIKCAVGQAVKSGETVIVLEAMKMQNNIEAECDGTVKEILVGKGDSVMEGATLVVIG